MCLPGFKNHPIIEASKQGKHMFHRLAKTALATYDRETGDAVTGLCADSFKTPILPFKFRHVLLKKKVGISCLTPSVNE
jgi:hypothetical protein